MGCSANRRKHLDKLLILSQGTLREQQIEEITMKTYFNHRELVYLYTEFKKLNPDNSQKIRVSSFLEFPNLKHCTFKRFLIQAFGLDVKQLEKEEREMLKLAAAKSADSEVVVPKIDDKLKSASSNRTRKTIDIDHPLDTELKLKDNIFKARSSKLDGLDINNYIFYDDRISNYNANVVSNQESELIDFKAYCNYLKVFNPRYPTDFKIKFYFKIFDVDGDGYISRNDILEFIKTVSPLGESDDAELNEKMKKEIRNENEMVENEENIEIEEKLEKINKEEKIKELYSINPNDIANIIFKEVTGTLERTHIEFDEFQKVMWMTSIDKTCNIYIS